MKAIPDYPGYYADELGNIWSTKKGEPHQIKQFPHAPNGRPYQYVVIMGKDKKPKRCRVHRLILSAYFGAAPTPKHHGRHLNNDSLDNRIANLAWGTWEDNFDDNLAIGKPFGKSFKRLLLSQVREIIQAQGKSQKELAAQHGVSRSYISLLRSGRRRKDLLAQ